MKIFNASGTHLHVGWEEGKDTKQFARILVGIVPEVLQRFAEKNAEYGNNANRDLGIKAQFVDIHRKMIKLRRALWDDEPQALKSEPVEEVIGDLVAHLLLTLDMLREGDQQVELRAPDEIVLGSLIGDDLVSEYEPNFKGRHSYLIASPTNRFASRGYSVLLPTAGQERCPWFYGEPTNGDRQCVGVAEHQDMYDGGSWHINKELQVWR